MPIANPPGTLHSAPAVARTADTLLRATGGRRVLLRLPAPASPLASEQLGLGTSYFQDVPLAPAVFRKARAQLTAGAAPTCEMLLSATIVELTVGSLEFASPTVLFATAIGVLLDDELFTIESATTEQAFGKAYLYRLVLRAPAAQSV